MSNSPINTLLVVLCLVVSGCSTFESHRSYIDSENGQFTIGDYEGISASISFSKYPDFVSIGILGLPVIPVYVRLISEDTIELKVNLSMSESKDFSLKLRPCIRSDSSEVICASTLQVYSMAQHKDGGEKSTDKRPRWNSITAFRKLDSLLINLENNRSSDRLSRDDIYDFYGYKGIPAIEHFTSSFTYSFKCNSKCPESFETKMDGFFVFEGKGIPLDKRTYVLKRDSEYYFIRAIQ